MPVDVSRIPQRLKIERRWVCWRAENETKVPYQANSPKRKASSTRSHEWANFEDALASYSSNDFDGIGFCLGDGYVGIDIDQCVSNGHVCKEAQEIVDNIKSYAEISPSGTGVRVMLIATKRMTRCQTVPSWCKKLETYGWTRYLTITGDAINVHDVEQADEAYQDFCSKWFSDQAIPVDDVGDIHPIRGAVAPFAVKLAMDDAAFRQT